MPTRITRKMTRMEPSIRTITTDSEIMTIMEDGTAVLQVTTMVALIEATTILLSSHTGIHLTEITIII